ncbi:MAG: hydroxyacylglutathione hydrolase [Pseudomonadota bacterium]|nr:hydroxyacylglutathione hydrolase [Pseudomonadota bacterium]
MLQVDAISAFKDNYIWVLHDPEQTGSAWVVDPGDWRPVEAYLDRSGKPLGGILITHHHPDHTAGLARLARERTNLPIVGPAGERIGGLTHAVQEGETVSLQALDRAAPDVEFDVIEVPGHTRGHIAYHAPGQALLFCGDTLFSCGCGRLFEGTAAQMVDSLAKLRELPPDTAVYPAHEYTLANIVFAQTVEPENLALAQRQHEAQRQRQQGRPTLPTSIDVERATNPFLRWDEPAVTAAAEARAETALDAPAEVFAALRAWKDDFG